MKDNSFEFDLTNFNKLHLVAKSLPDILLHNSKEIPINPILEKIFVSRPYFAFSKVYQFGDILISPITQEQPIGFESTPMSSAEASRHLAILGSCALAINKEDQQYYLAVKARKKVGIDTINKNTFCNSSQLYVLAMPLFINEKEAAAITILTNIEGDIIFNFMIGYQLFTKKLFDRVFKKHSKPTEKIDYSPYREAFKFRNIVIDKNVLKATLPIMKVEQCAGHFDNFPMLPVGVLAYMAINTIGYFLNNITQNTNLRYYLLNAEMDVFAPTFIEEESELIVTYSGYDGNQHNFSWVMKSMNSKNILNTMNVSFFTSHEIFDTKIKTKIHHMLVELDQYKKMYSELAYKLYQTQNSQTNNSNQNL